MKLGQNACLDEISDKFDIGSCVVKTRSLDQILDKPCVRSRGNIFGTMVMKLIFRYTWNLIRMFALMISRMSLKMDHVKSKTRSLGQILEKPCVLSRGHIFSLIIMKLDQNVFLMKSRTSLKIGHVGSKTNSQSQILKHLVYALKATFQSNNHVTLSECLSWWNLGRVWKWVMSGKKVGNYVKC